MAVLKALERQKILMTARLMMNLAAILKSETTSTSSATASFGVATIRTNQ
jgi:hypothetical protein